MQKIMLMFPGQGSQYVGMGKDLYEKYPAAKNIIEMLGADLKKIMFEGTEEDLKNTQNAQPAIFAASMACFEILKQSADLNKFEIITAGHSLGNIPLCARPAFLIFKTAFQWLKQEAGLFKKHRKKIPELWRRF